MDPYGFEGTTVGSVIADFTGWSDVAVTGQFAASEWKQGNRVTSIGLGVTTVIQGADATLNSIPLLGSAKMFAGRMAKGVLRWFFGSSAKATVRVVTREGAGQLAKQTDKVFQQLAKSSNEACEQVTKRAGARSGGLRAEKALLGRKKHGVGWTEGPARAKKTGKPQGQFGSTADVDFAVGKAEGLGVGKSDVFDLPSGHNSVVHLPDGSTVPATKVWVRRNASGTVHAYPIR